MSILLAASNMPKFSLLETAKLIPSIIWKAAGGLAVAGATHAILCALYGSESGAARAAVRNVPSASAASASMADLSTISEVEFLSEAEWEKSLESLRAEDLSNFSERVGSALWNHKPFAPSAFYRLHRRLTSLSKARGMDRLKRVFELTASSGEAELAPWAALGVCQAITIEQVAESYAELPAPVRRSLIAALSLAHDFTDIPPLLNATSKLDENLALKGTKSKELRPAIQTFSSIYPRTTLAWLASKEGSAFRELRASALLTLVAINGNSFDAILTDAALKITPKELGDSMYRADFSFGDIAVVAGKLSKSEKEAFLTSYGEALASGSPVVLHRFVTEKPALELPAESVRRVASRLLANLPQLFEQFLETRPANERQDLCEKAFRGFGASTVKGARAVLASPWSEALPRDLEKRAIEVLARDDLQAALLEINRRPAERRSGLRAAAYARAGSYMAVAGTSSEAISGFLSDMPSEYRLGAATEVIKTLALAEPKTAIALLQGGIAVSDDAWLHFLQFADLPAGELFEVASRRLTAVASPAVYQKIVESLVDRYGQQSVAIAVDAVMNMPEGDARVACLNTVVNRWLRLDAMGVLILSPLSQQDVREM